MVWLKWSRISFFHSTFIYILYIRVSIFGFFSVKFYFEIKINSYDYRSLRLCRKLKEQNCSTCHPVIGSYPRLLCFFHEDWNNVSWSPKFFPRNVLLPSQDSSHHEDVTGHYLCLMERPCMNAFYSFWVLLYNFFLFRILQLISQSTYWFSAPMQNTFCYCIFQHIFNFQLNFESALVYLNNSSCLFPAYCIGSLHFSLGYLQVWQKIYFIDFHTDSSLLEY